jgi:hypothetical protein
MKQSVFLVSTAAFVMLLIAALLIFGPIFVIWSLNTLFPILAIPYTIETWVSVVILSWALNTKINFKKD